MRSEGHQTFHTGSKADTKINIQLTPSREKKTNFTYISIIERLVLTEFHESILQIDGH